MICRSLVLTLLIALFTSGSVLADLALQHVDSPAADGSGEPRLYVTRGGQAYLSWIEAVGEDSALRFSRWTGTAWSSPRTIAEGDDWFVNWADFPSLVELNNGTLVAHWLQKEAADTYAYGVRLSFSQDDGEIWSDPIVPHNDGTPTEHGFVSMIPWGHDRVLINWLDGRKYAPTITAAGDTIPGPQEMQIRAALFDNVGKQYGEWVIDDRVCDCCQTTLAAVEGGAVVAYRDRTSDEIRDISFSRFDGRSWSTPVAVADQNWKIAGCPVNGPTASARGKDVAVAWFSAAADTGRVSVAFSSDAGQSFGQATRVDGGDPLGRVDTVLLSDGSAVVSWMDSDEDGGAHLRLRRIARDGTRAPIRTFANSSAQRASGFPQMALLGDQLLLAWRVTGEDAGIRTAVGVLSD